MAENLPSLMKDMNTNIPRAQQTQTRMSSKKSTPRHVIIKLSKDKEQNWENSYKEILGQIEGDRKSVV